LQSPELLVLTDSRQDEPKPKVRFAPRREH
jgi:hypothetical protein